MKGLWIILAEIKKQFRITYHSKLTFISLVIWPFLHFCAIYYSYKPYNLSAQNTSGNILQSNELFLFVLTGFIGFQFFWTMVQSAFGMRYERSSGTLESIVIAPVNLIFIMYGRALGSIVENLWMLMILCGALFFYNPNIVNNQIYLFPAILLALVVAATIWGGLLNSIFLFSRDTSYFFYILNSPMELFSGARISPESFPVWGRLISMIFPLTHILLMIRGLIGLSNSFDFWSNLLSLGLSLIAIMTITVFILSKVERNYKKNGELNFY